MSRHTCTQCGFETPSKRDTWPHQHPICAALIALPTLYTIIGVILAYPWFMVPLLVAGCAVWVDRRNRRRAAIAARADHAYRREMLRAVRDSEAAYTAKLNAEAKRMAAKTALPMYVMDRWPTTPMPTAPLRRLNSPVAMAPRSDGGRTDA